MRIRNSLTKIAIVSLLGLVFIAPFAFAQAPDFKFFGQPLVPQCDAKNVCTVCDIFRLLQNLINFTLSMGVLIGIIMIAYGGILMLLGGASPALIEKGKKVIRRSLTGIVIILIAWLGIDIVIKLLAQGDNTLGLGQPWYKIKCEAPPFPLTNTTGTGGSTGTAGGDPFADWENAQGDEGQALRNPAGNLACASFTPAEEAAINTAAAQYGVSPNRIRALISRESGGNQNAQSTDNDGGHSHGLMQIRLETAQTIDSGATIERLRDPAYNIDIGSRYYGNLLRQYGGNHDLAAAAYNGGTRANQPSVNCPGSRRWQCEYDSNDHSVRNERPGHPGYGVTRRYVPAINVIEQKFESGTCS